MIKKKTKNPIRIISKQYFKTLKIINEYKYLQDTHSAQINKLDPSFLNVARWKSNNYFFTRYWIYIEPKETSIFSPKQMMNTYGQVVNYKEIKNLLKQTMKKIILEFNDANNYIQCNSISELAKCMVDIKEYPELNMIRGYVVDPNIIKTWLRDKNYIYKISKTKKMCIALENNKIKMVFSLAQKGTSIN